MVHARGTKEALAFLQTHTTGVVICHADPPHADWQNLLGQCTRLDLRPHIVVCCRLADDRLWAEVLNLGGFDLIAMPFEADEVVRVSTEAWRAWNRDFCGLTVSESNRTAGCV
jgi:DNA-binding NtrC family response regulator